MKQQPHKESNSNLISFLVKNSLLVSVGGVVLLFIIFLLVLKQLGSDVWGNIAAFLNLSSSEPEVDVPTLVVKQIRGASELTTAIFTMEAVVPTRQDSKLGEVVIGTTTLLYVAHGEVRAGVDLSKIEAEDVTYTDETETVTIQLPPPEILDSKIDVDRSKVYHYDRGFLNLGPDVAPELQTLAQRETLQKIRETACDKGLLTDANERAELTIEKLVNTAGYQQVEVVAAPVSTEACQAQVEGVGS